MADKKVTKTFTVTATPGVMRRFERFMALLHYNAGFGHSAHFAMFLDGDGWDKFELAEVDKRLKNEVDVIGCVGRDVEIACTDKYIARSFRKDVPTSYWTEHEGTTAHLCKGDTRDGDERILVRTIGDDDDE
jgi:hypothetical protein